MAIIWILGEYGEHIEDSPYMLENMVKNIDNAIDTSKVKHIVFGLQHTCNDKNIILVTEIMCSIILKKISGDASNIEKII